MRISDWSSYVCSSDLQARAATRLEHFDSDSHREGLDVFLRDVNACEYTEAGMQRLIGSVVGALSTRLQVTDYLAGRPELRQRPVERPVFVFGVPRNGTTLLSTLLAADPQRPPPPPSQIDHPAP